MSQGSPSASTRTPRRPFSEILADRRAALASQIGPWAPFRGKVTLEVGCGHGHFLTALARTEPATLCIGVDNDSDRIRRASRKQAREKLQNLHFIRADAELLIEVLPEELHLGAVYVLFPDPWPKLRHHKHRILQPKFLAALSRRMNHDAALFFRTDFTPYFEDAKATFLQEKWIVSEGAPWPFEHVSVFQSRAESFRSLVARPPCAT